MCFLYYFKSLQIFPNTKKVSTDIEANEKSGQVQMKKQFSKEIKLIMNEFVHMFKFLLYPHTISANNLI